ncbi:MAG: PLD nuclease N-terminal domain-containing protein [Opitutales bacterium]
MENPSIIQQLIWRYPLYPLYPFFDDPETQLLFNVLFFTFLAFFLVVWIYTLIDCLRSDFRGNNDKIAWILVLIFLPMIGTPVYIGIAKGQKKYRIVIPKPAPPQDRDGSAP